MKTDHISTDEMKKAIQGARDLYQFAGNKAYNNGWHEAAEIFRSRYELFKTLLEDDHACDMLAGRIDEIKQRRK